MFKWVSRKFTQSELNNDLKGLRSLSGYQRAKTATVIYAHILKGFESLSSDVPLQQVQEMFAGWRREAVKTATGYDDPRHLETSLPEAFFLTFAEAYPCDGMQVRREIANALKTIVEEDMAEFFSADQVPSVKAEYESFWIRLKSNNLI